jgi:hypothetical protein
MNINGNYINDYKNAIQNTNLQVGYQEFIKFFRYLRTYLEKEMKEYIFTSNIVENGMDYSYFQFTNAKMKSKGLKIVIVFVHKEFNYQVWLSGINRGIQIKYYEVLKKTKNQYTLTSNPDKTDYILKTNIINEFNYDQLELLLKKTKYDIFEFIDNINI